MKKIIATLGISLLSLLSSNAQKKANPEPDNKETVFVVIRSREESIKYTFTSIRDFEENTGKIFDEITPYSSKKSENSCNIVVEISLSAKKGETSKNIAASITTNDEQIKVEIKKIYENLLLAIK
ncbi:hypothetical protein EZL74_00995 [Flavobacterium silvisoli]|uniref:DUF3568 family protein n=1 Tax=Flavobacterium silvisoli TaxID=2529433 RepID=A0A4Q9Z4L8_9FLAO|nr:hypothetical protein [Flavobacterium silvisoli]TBX71110.1 hypothetical protein EZL74_00995 [Flavobacterium silvisoli]